jgi:hypothetical protein
MLRKKLLTLPGVIAISTLFLIGGSSAAIAYAHSANTASPEQTTTQNAQDDQHESTIAEDTDDIQEEVGDQNELDDDAEADDQYEIDDGDENDTDDIQEENEDQNELDDQAESAEAPASAVTK